jgi:N-acetylmuramoyl-L-alanine amidase
MKRVVTAILILLGLGILGIYSLKNLPSGAPPYGVTEPPDDLDPLAWLKDWQRPKGPARVGLQAGHWQNDNLPEELHNLEGNGGTAGGGKSEAEVNLEIAERTKRLLEERGVNVDLLPTTIPVSYWADAFVAIHADGSLDHSVTGFKLAAPRRDFTGRADDLLDMISSYYEAATRFDKDPNVSRNMRGYYAFAWWRFDHAIHPMTPAVILETGFLTNPKDRRIIVDQPELAAQGLAEGIIKFLANENLL